MLSIATLMVKSLLDASIWICGNDRPDWIPTWCLEMGSDFVPAAKYLQHIGLEKQHNLEAALGDEGSKSE